VTEGLVRRFPFFVLLALLGSSQAEADQLPSGAVLLTPAELFSMYAGMTRQAKEGVGGYYFSPDRRLAVLSTGKSYGYGRWWITTSGKVCMRVTWRWGRGAGAASSEEYCMGHAKVGRRIWKEYDGEWYEWTGNESKRFSPGYKYQEQVNARAQLYGR
jgi:Protein of unknown function (DUF995)